MERIAILRFLLKLSYLVSEVQDLTTVVVRPWLYLTQKAQTPISFAMFLQVDRPYHHAKDY